MSTSASSPGTSKIRARAAGRSRRRSKRRCPPRCCRQRFTQGFARARTTPLPKKSCRRCASSLAGTRSPRKDKGTMVTQLDPAAGHSVRPAKAPPCAIVIFGASGDLTKRLLMPALYNLAKAGRLSDKFALIGVDRSEKAHEDFREELAQGVRRFVSDTASASVAEPFDEKTWNYIAARMTHVDGDVTNPELYRELAEALKAMETEHGTGGNVIFYLAVASSLF